MKINVERADQRTQVGNDGKAPEDGNMDCVPTSLAQMVRALNPGATINGTPVTGDGLHDAVYGQGYTGMQDPARYVGLLAGFGVQMLRVEGTPQVLVARAAAEIADGRPVLLSIPSDWGDEPPHSQYAHMVAGCDVPDANSLTAMNPWGGFYQTQSRAWWAERLAHCSYAGIWVLSRTGEGINVGVPAGWKDVGEVLTAPNGIPINGYIREHLIAAEPQWPADMVPVAPMRGVTGGWEMDFAASRSVVATTTGTVTEKAGPDYRVQISGLEQQLAQEKGVAAQLSQEAANLNTQLSAAQAEIKTLQDALAAATPSPRAKAAEQILDALASYLQVPKTS